jgi:hypothetical protein
VELILVRLRQLQRSDNGESIWHDRTHQLMMPAYYVLYYKTFKAVIYDVPNKLVCLSLTGLYSLV